MMNEHSSPGSSRKFDVLLEAAAGPARGQARLFRRLGLCSAPLQLHCTLHTAHCTALHTAASNKRKVQLDFSQQAAFIIYLTVQDYNLLLSMTLIFL
jgi:hypothetical protein